MRHQTHRKLTTKPEHLAHAQGHQAVHLEALHRKQGDTVGTSAQHHQPTRLTSSVDSFKNFSSSSPNKDHIRPELRSEQQTTMKHR